MTSRPASAPSRWRARRYCSWSRALTPEPDVEPDLGEALPVLPRLLALLRERGLPSRLPRSCASARTRATASSVAGPRPSRSRAPSTRRARPSTNARRSSRSSRSARPATIRLARGAPRNAVALHGVGDHARVAEVLEEAAIGAIREVEGDGAMADVAGAAAAGDRVVDLARDGGRRADRSARAGRASSRARAPSPARDRRAPPRASRSPRAARSSPLRVRAGPELRTRGAPRERTSIR